MNLNAVIDEDLHRSLAEPLTKLGFSVYDIRNHDLRGEPDSRIFKFAQEKQAILFSGDLGFSNILDFPLGEHFGICILRYPNEMSTQAINGEVLSSLSKLQAGDFQGNLVILSPGQIRLRRSPKDS